MTAFYTGLFLATTAILLLVVNLLLRRMLASQVTSIENGRLPSVKLPAVPSTAPTGGAAPTPQIDPIQAIGAIRDAVLRFQWGVTAATIVVLAVVSILAGWWLAGRLLHPLHQITATARRLSASNLNERIVLTGPADELTELAQTFNAMLDRLERAVEVQRRFAANASHELRTPLTIQRAAIEIGLDDPTPEDLSRVRTELLAANRRTERLIDGLLVLAQSERDLDGTQPVQLDQLVRQVVDELPTDGIAVVTQTEPTVVVGDPVLLARMIANLVGNAVQYNHAGGSVTVALAAPATLEVRNTGPEISADRVKELFEPFRRGPAARTGKGAGAGLGLSIVAAIARAHGGSVRARPGPDGGLVVTVAFPHELTARR